MEAVYAYISIDRTLSQVNYIIYLSLFIAINENMIMPVK